MMRSVLVRALCLAVLAAGPQVASAAKRQAKPASLPGGANALQESYQDWQVSCTVSNNARHCALSQQQRQKNGRRVLAIELAATGDGGVHGTLVLPFGLDLGKGVTLHLDKNAASSKRLAFSTCLPVGCLVPLDLDKPFVQDLRKGHRLTINAGMMSGKTIAFALPLKGFSAALDRVVSLAK